MANSAEPYKKIILFWRVLTYGFLGFISKFFKNFQSDIVLAVYYYSTLFDLPIKILKCISKQKLMKIYHVA